MKPLGKLFALSALITSAGLYAALPVEGIEPTKGGINVPTPETGGVASDKTSVKTPLSEVLRLKDGDTLHGNLASVEDGRMIWTRPDIKTPIEMTLENIRGIRLHRHSKSNDRGSTKVLLTNGDVIYGELVSINEEDFVIDTWYAGRLTMPRCMVNTVQPGNKAGALILASIGKLGDWTQGQGKWKLQAGKLQSYGRGQIGRILELPDRMHFQVTTEWTTSSPDFRIVTYTNNINSYYGDCYSLRMSSSSISLKGGQNNRTLASGQYQKMYSIKKAKIDLYIDKKAKKGVIFVNGEQAMTWNNLDFSPSGNGIMLYSGYNPVTFSKLRITKWDGKVPDKGASDDTATAEDLVRFSNGDKMSGKIISLENGKVTLKTQFATMPVPTENIGLMVFNSKESENARKYKGDVNLYFVNGDRITLKLLSYAGGKFKGKSENFETKVFDARAFTGVRFNIYAGDDEDEDSEDSESRFYEFLFDE